MGLAELLRLVGQACAGVAHMHQRGWAHLEIQPQNCLLFAVEGRLALKVADLGLARAMSRSGMCDAGERWWCAPAPCPA